MKRTLMQRLARNIDTNDPTKCWSWTGRVTLVTETLRPHYSRRDRRMTMAVDRALPLIQVDGKRQSPARLMYEIVTGNTLPAKFTLRRNKRLCPDRLCINPHHRIPPGGESILPPVEEPRQLEYSAAPDDIQDLSKNSAKRWAATSPSQNMSRLSNVNPI